MLELQEIYKATDLKGIISIEDEWSFSDSAENILFDIYCAPAKDKVLFLQEVEKIDKGICGKIQLALEQLHKVKFEIQAKGKIYRYIDNKETLSVIKGFTDEDAQNILNISNRYGFGLNDNGVVSLKDVICKAREDVKLPVRIFSDFLADDKEQFELDIHTLTKEAGYVLCIIDDQLKGTNRAHEIISTIENAEFKDKVICVLVTSNDNSSNQKSNSNIYVEYVKKGDNEEHFIVAYIKSLYRIMLKQIQKVKIDAIDEAFDSAFKNVNTAFFIAKMAQKEGSLNFDLILKWIEAKELQKSEEQISTIRKAIILSNTLNNVQADEVFEDEFEEDQLYHTDTFDLTINELYRPLEIGDVFEVNEKYFVLIGQECDLAIRKNGKRKTELLEFVSAEIGEVPLDNHKVEHGFECAIIKNFFHQGKNKYISINCSKRYYGKTEIFDMCSFNKNGEAKIFITKPIELEAKALLPEGMVKRYDAIQKAYENLTKIKDIIPEDLLNDFKNSISMTNDINEAINLLEYSYSNSTISYKVKRICRLRKHAHLLHKLYLSYRGRQAEEAIYFSRYQPFDYYVGDKILRAQTLINTNSKKNELHNLPSREWIIDTRDINDYLETQRERRLEISAKYLRLPKCINEIGGYVFTKQFDEATNRVNLLIVKKK